MKALLFGARGQVGRALLASVPADISVKAFDRTTLDLTDTPAITLMIAAAAPDLVINASGYTAVDKAESEADLAMRINADAPEAMARAAQAVGARFVHLSTDFVFDGTASAPYSPQAAPNPLSVYGQTKLAGEQAVLAASPDALIIRTAWVYATGGANFVETMLRLMDERESISVVADQIGTPTHADSLARAVWTLAQARQAGVLHFTDAGVASWYDFAIAVHDLGRAAGLLESDVRVVPIPTTAYPTLAARPAYSVLDKAATWAALGAPAEHWRHELAIMIMKKRDLLHG